MATPAFSTISEIAVELMPLVVNSSYAVSYTHLVYPMIQPGGTLEDMILDC